jgi:hypothetical protein
MTRPAYLGSRIDMLHSVRPGGNGLESVGFFTPRVTPYKPI